MDKELLGHKFILFCQDHYNPLGIVRSLGEKGIRPIAIMVVNDGYTPKLIPKSKYIGIIHYVNSIEEGYTLLKEEYGKEQKKPFLYSSSDDIGSYLDLHYNELINQFFFFHGKEQGIVTKYMNKSAINQLAENSGFSVLKNQVVKKGELPQGLRYPVITKAIISTLYAWKGDMHICNNEDELKEAYKTIRSEEILIQEFIKKKNELCLDGFSYNNGEEVIIPYYTNYLRFTDDSYGGSMILKPFSDDRILDNLRKLFKEIGFTGIFEVEFLIDQEDNYHFLEVNFRNSTWSYAYTYGGYDMPYLWAKATVEGRLNLSSIQPKELIHAISEEDDFSQYVKTRKIGICKWIYELFKADCLFLFNKKDCYPGLKMLIRMLGGQILRNLGLKKV